MQAAAESNINVGVTLAASITTAVVDDGDQAAGDCLAGSAATAAEDGNDGVATASDEEPSAADADNVFEEGKEDTADGDAAVDAMIKIIRTDRQWNEDAGRTQLLKFFEAWGPMDPASVAGRRALSTVLFS